MLKHSTLAFMLAVTTLVLGATWQFAAEASTDRITLLSADESASLLGGQTGCLEGDANCRCDALTCTTDSCPDTTVTAACTYNGYGYCHQFFANSLHEHCGISSTSKPAGCSQSTSTYNRCGIVWHAYIPSGNCFPASICQSHRTSDYLSCGDYVSFCFD